MKRICVVFILLACVQVATAIDVPLSMSGSIDTLSDVSITITHANDSYEFTASENFHVVLKGTPGQLANITAQTANATASRIINVTGIMQDVHLSFTQTNYSEPVQRTLPIPYHVYGNIQHPLLRRGDVELINTRTGVSAPVRESTAEGIDYIASVSGTVGDTINVRYDDQLLESSFDLQDEWQRIDINVPDDTITPQGLAPPSLRPRQARIIPALLALLGALILFLIVWYKDHRNVTPKSYKPHSCESHHGKRGDSADAQKPVDVRLPER